MKKITDYKQHLESLWAKHLLPKENNAPTVISLFAGGGGSSLGYSMAGFKELAMVEYWKQAYTCFQRNFPDVPVISSDIRETSVETILEIAKIKPGELSCLDMSPVCCGFSSAGKQQLDDPRNFLFREAVRILKGIQPKSFIMENVKQIASPKFSEIFQEIESAFDEAGYRTSWKTMKAYQYGAATKRERFFMVGIRKDLNKSFVFPEPMYEPVILKEVIGDLEDDPDYVPLTEKYLGYWEKALCGKPMTKFKCEKKVNPEGVCFTILKGAHLYHYKTPRQLSIKEMSRIQGFTENFKFRTHNEAREIIGNSVCPPVMYVLSSELRKQVLDGLNLTTVIDLGDFDPVI